MLSLLISTVVFFLASWLIRRYLDDQGIPGGMTRGITIFVFAALISWGSAAAITWIQGETDSKPAITSNDMGLQLKDKVEVVQLWLT